MAILPVQEETAIFFWAAEGLQLLTSNGNELRQLLFFYENHTHWKEAPEAI